MQSTQTTRTLSDRRSTFTARSGFLGGIFGGDIGDSTRTARNIGTLRSGRSYDHSGDVGGRDLDFFRFTTDRRLSITAKLENDDRRRDDPIAMTLLDRNGSPLARGNGRFLFVNVPHEETGTITARLAAGTYFVRLESARGNNQDYNFEISASSTGTGNGNGSNSLNFEDERDLGRLRAGEGDRFSGRVGGSDIDGYRFSIGDRSRIVSELSNEGNDDIAFRLINDRGQTVQTSSGRFLFANVESDESQRLIAPTLAAGTYYFVVQSDVGRSEDYRFSVRNSGNVEVI
ncbi:MAG: hypothetical protein MUF49_07150 [Oculatellaceae cyanobacterium Prado106]|nr:hypothetical protein [Oculatellaceae cyanobacterium Prado106]